MIEHRLFKLTCYALTQLIILSVVALAAPPTWVQVDQQKVLPANNWVHQLAALDNASVLAVAGINEIFASTDSGMTWQVIPGLGAIPSSERLIAVSGYIGQNADLYAGGYQALYKRTITPNGPTWQVIFQQSAVSVSALAHYHFDAAEPQQLIAGLAVYSPADPVPQMPAIQFSTDGVNWDRSTTGYPLGGAAFPVSMAVSGSDITVQSYDAGVFASHDGGKTFISIGLKGEIGISAAILQHPTSKAWYHFAGNSAGLFRASFDNPQFVKIGPSSTLLDNKPVSVIGVGTILVGGFYGRGVYYSPLCGDTGSWQPLSDGLPSTLSQIYTFGTVGTYMFASIGFTDPTGKGTYGLFRIDVSSLIWVPPPTPTPPATPPPPVNLHVVP